MTRREALRRKAREIVAGHRDNGAIPLVTAQCRECAMTWPCHARLLADAILALDPREGNPGRI